MYFENEFCDDVKCPNYCTDGRIKISASSIYALWQDATCPYCKGKGVVSIKKAEEIEKIL